MQLQTLHTTAYMDCLKLSTQTWQTLLQARETSEKVWRHRFWISVNRLHFKQLKHEESCCMTVSYGSNQHSLDFSANYSYLNYPKSQTTALPMNSSKLYRKSCKIMPAITCHANTGTLKTF